MKVHYNNALNPKEWVILACHANVNGKPIVKVTTDVKFVTCKRCLKILGGRK